MIPENFKILVDKLTEKTKKKEAIWYKTSGNNEFKLDLGKGAITVDTWEYETGSIMMVGIDIINENGDKIDYMYIASYEREDYEYLFDFHSLVRRSVYKVEETFKMIFEELDSNKTVGTERKIDVLPFG